MIDPRRCTQTTRKRRRRNPGALFLGIGVLLIQLVPAAAAQLPTDKRIISVGTVNHTGYFLIDSAFVAVDFETTQVHRRDLRHILRHFPRDVEPLNYSTAVSLDGQFAWLWDSSVGATVKIGLQADTSITYSPRRSSYTQFVHAGGLSPLTGLPLAFSGYGYYRAHDFMLTFDEMLDTWTEVPYSTDSAPEPRMESIMASQWNPSKVLVAGGNGSKKESTPPNYTIPLTGAWIFDLEQRTWTEIDAPLWIACALKSSQEFMGYVPGDVSSGSILLVVRDTCVDETHFINTVHQWFPESGNIVELGSVSATLPTFARPVGMYLDADSTHLNYIFWRPLEGENVEEWAQWKFQFVLAEAPRMASSGMRSKYGWFILISMVLAAVAAGGLFVMRKKEKTPATTTVKIGIDHAESIAVMSNNGVEHSHQFSQNAIILLAHFVASNLSAGATIISEDLLPLFEADYPDIDTARVVKNRGVGEINKYFKSTYGMPLLDRQRRDDDRRKHIFRVMYTLEQT